MAGISGHFSISKDHTTPTSLVQSSSQAISGFKVKQWEIEKTQLRFSFSLRKAPKLRLMASGNSPGLTQEAKDGYYEGTLGTKNKTSIFEEMKHRFLMFKKHKYMENLEDFKNLAEVQAPKFLVIACADSRVCPSSILGFQPGEAFTVRNIANLVPPFESGPSETKAALEFSVNFLNVENILVIGHSCCGGIRALMSMEDEADSGNFIQDWVIIGKKARINTKATASGLHFDHQCRHCEKESVNCSLQNLLSYPWIEEKVQKGSLSIHGGYYDFIDCTFEKWTLDYKGSEAENEGCGGVSIKDRSVWR